MRKWNFLGFILMLSVFPAFSQESGSFNLPKYLPENRAATLLNFFVDQNNNQATISIESLRDVKDYSFYILKGISNENGREGWSIIASFRNTNEATFNKKVTDYNQGHAGVMYRVMVIDSDQNIEYTPIICLRDARNRDNTNLTSAQKLQTKGRFLTSLAGR